MRVAGVLLVAVLAVGCRQLFGIDDTAVAPDAPATPAPDAPPDAVPGPDAAPVTLTFRDGFGGYGGTQDTFLEQGSPNNNHGPDPEVQWDIDTNGDLVHGLIQFTGIFGSLPNQIPPGSTIVGATLTVRVIRDTVPPAGTVAEITIPWVQSHDWNNFGPMPGVQVTDVGAVVAAAPISGTTIVSVTPSLQAWSADPSTNHGWIVSPANDDDAGFASSEDGQLADRPLLTVTFLAP